MTLGSPYLDTHASRQDYIICGTGLTECVLSGLLSVDGKKVRDPGSLAWRVMALKSF
jgi:hypothetical protein